jgi:signal transduction histidine kinase
MAAVAVINALGLSGLAWSSGAADGAFLAFGSASAILIGLWRLRGDAAAFDLGSAALVLGLFLVPTTARLASSGATYVPALRASSFVVAVGILLYSTCTPEVRADLRPHASLLLRIGLAPLLALPLAAAPAASFIGDRIGPFAAICLLEAFAGAAVALVIMAKGLGEHRGLLLGAGGAIMAVAGASAATSVSLPAGWSSLPSLFLLVGSLELVAVAGGELRTTIASVVRRNLRGRRRWEAAESELNSVSRSYRGLRHDIKGILSAMDGTLFVLLRARAELPHDEVDRLISAMREEIQSLQSLLTARPSDTQTYDASELIRAVVAVHRATLRRAVCDVEPGLLVEGSPDRLAIVLSDLLTNAGVHAPNASVRVTAKRHGARGETLEVTVADDGPGLPEAEYACATRAGWRGPASHGIPGSGLGLAQCLDLVEAGGGDLTVGATNPGAGEGHRGFTVEVRLPMGGRPLPSAACGDLASHSTGTSVA